ncbi:peptidase C14 caspase catalytic subunit p20 (plasmid) [Rhizobium leguminosarum bv. trifolii WSM1325]|uniref:Peptidase C14 caspase catalytic subunit p20 n=1 Tax=Rhizobium leguminosarum bv. trifolii (strain WSM1325) TaxID=395491 RepID=C6BB53_RHILS|nr:caspase family protein [Rhizobium leguminosarum]ACS61311.1 peptidase C14 caspase catalytic subunit p20 [Rhizobium leguminosarum bv. trifolii WSM1325]
MRPVAAFVLCFVLFSLPASAEQRPGLHALLVGVGTYQNSNGGSFRNLRGPANDVPALESVLRDRYGLMPANTETLIDQAAKRQAVVDGLQKLLSDAAIGDVVLFYFSGHGSRQFDKSMDETSQLDDTILPYDARDKDGKIPDIIDDELSSFVAKALDRGLKPVVILDSCHSGTGTRLWAQARTVPALNEPAAGWSSNKSQASQHNIFTGDSILLAAAQDDEEALESDRDGVVRGEFSRALVRVLETAEEDVTYLDVLTRVRVTLNSQGVPHNPQGEGGLSQKFLGAGPLGKLPVRAEPEGAQRVKLFAGAVSGVTQGSQFALFTTAAEAGRGFPVLTDGVVTAVHPASAEIDLKKDVILPARLFAMEQAHSFGDLRLRVALSGGDEVKRGQVKDVIEKLSFVEIVPDRDATQWLDVSDKGVRLKRLDGSAVGPVRPLSAFTEGQGALLLGRLARYQALLSLSNPENPNAPVRARVLLATKGSDKVSNPKMQDGEAVIKPRQSFVLGLYNGSVSPKHAYVLNLDADYCVRLLMPPPSGSDEPLLGSVRTKLLRAPDRAGREYFLIISTDRPIAPEALEQDCLTDETLRQGLATKLGDPLAQLLANAASTQRGPTPELSVKGWSTSFVSLVVRED